MDIVVNAEPRTLPEQTSLADLIEQLGLAGAPCAAEVNKTLVPKREHAQRTLVAGDTVELVTLVGGG